MSLRAKLILCISFLAAAAIIVTAFAFYALDKEAEISRSIVADRVVPMEQLKRVADAYAVNIVDTIHKVRAGSMTAAHGADNIRSALKTIDDHWRDYRATTLTAEEKQIADQFDAARSAADRKVKDMLAIVEGKDAEALKTLAEKDLYPTIDPLGGPINSLIDLQIRVAKEGLATGEELTTLLNRLMIGLALAAAATAAVSMWIVLKGVIGPIHHITAAMARLAGGDTAVTIYGEGRKDEIGAMATTVGVFRDNAIDRKRLEEEAEANRTLSERERAERERAQQREASEVKFAVDHLADGLAELDAGNLTTRLGEPFADHLDRVRVSFNNTVDRLEHAIQKVSQNAQTIAAGSGQIRASAADLSKRTEQQAASVEETAAALEEITTTVTDASLRAEEAGRLVVATRENAERSGQIVNRAIKAMHEIETSSNEISNIIGVIDEIAFQTNLLALNAGVEAARAGDAGKGFAVVAQEVRELAQRSATAAKEIKALINKSGDQVRDGVQLVSETGEVLEEMVGQVRDIDRNVLGIVEASKEQAVGLREINTAVNAMDQGTQQNAAMVEESTAASHSLASDAEALFALVGQFKIGAGGPIGQALRRSAPVAAAEPARDRPAPSPARKLVGKLASAFATPSAGAASAAASWEEF